MKMEEYEAKKDIEKWNIVCFQNISILKLDRLPLGNKAWEMFGLRLWFAFHPIDGQTRFTYGLF